MRCLSSVIYPSLVAGGLACVHFAITRGVAVPIALLILQVSLVAIVAGLERWMPEHPSWNVARGDVRTDALYLLVSGFLLTTLMRAIVFGGTPSLGLWPTRWPHVAQVLLAMAVVDLGSYGTHVLTHKHARFWPIHAPHHSAERLYWLNATRMHPLDQMSTLAFSLVPVALLGAPLDVLLSFDAFAIVHLTVQHSNVRLRHGALSHVLATAEFHRWHHSKLREESECNYASFLSLWDHVFGTFRMPAHRSPPEEVGLYEGARLPSGFIAQLASPFRAWRRGTETRSPIP